MKSSVFDSNAQKRKKKVKLELNPHLYTNSNAIRTYDDFPAADRHTPTTTAFDFISIAFAHRTPRQLFTSVRTNTAKSHVSHVNLVLHRRMSRDVVVRMCARHICSQHSTQLMSMHREQTIHKHDPSTVLRIRVAARRVVEPLSVCCRLHTNANTIA